MDGRHVESSSRLCALHMKEANVPFHEGVDRPAIILIRLTY